MKRYTLGQVRAFMAAIERRERARARDALLVQRAALADDKAFRKALKGLGE